MARRYVFLLSARLAQMSVGVRQTTNGNIVSWFSLSGRVQNPHRVLIFPDPRECPKQHGRKTAAVQAEGMLAGLAAFFNPKGLFVDLIFFPIRVSKARVCQGTAGIENRARSKTWRALSTFSTRS